MNRVLLAVHVGSLEITLTVRLRIKESIQKILSRLNKSLKTQVQVCCLAIQKGDWFFSRRRPPNM